MSLKTHVKGQVRFQFYRKGELFYETDSGLIFTVPIADTGDGVFLAEDRAMLFMRYIRKQLEANEKGQLEAQPMTLAEQVADAQAVVASWTPEKRASVQLQGPVPDDENYVP